MAEDDKSRGARRDVQRASKRDAKRRTADDNQATKLKNRVAQWERRIRDATIAEPATDGLRGAADAFADAGFDSARPQAADPEVCAVRHAAAPALAAEPPVNNGVAAVEMCEAAVALRGAGTAPGFTTFDAATPGGPPPTHVTPAPPADEAVVVPASYLEDLHAAVEAERHRAQEMASTVARFQTLNAIAVQRRALDLAPGEASDLRGPRDPDRLESTEDDRSSRRQAPSCHREPAHIPMYVPDYRVGHGAGRLLIQVVYAILFSAAGFALVAYLLMSR